jgi:hypothetical protein
MFIRDAFKTFAELESRAGTRLPTNDDEPESERKPRTDVERWVLDWRWFEE